MYSKILLREPRDARWTLPHRENYDVRTEVRVCNNCATLWPSAVKTPCPAPSLEPRRCVELYLRSTYGFLAKFGRTLIFGFLNYRNTARLMLSCFPDTSNWWKSVAWIDEQTSATSKQSLASSIATIVD